MTDVDAVVEHLYDVFGRYPLPTPVEVCEECGPEWTAEDIRRTPLREVSLLQLEALHVMALDDNGFRHFFPRLIELLLNDPAPVFAFTLDRLRGRTPAWRSDERAAVLDLVETLWRKLLAAYPPNLGYFSDSPTLIDVTDWCDVQVASFLTMWEHTVTPAANEHLADLVLHLCTMSSPFDPAVAAQMRTWLAQPVIGERLAGTPAYEMWASALSS